VPVAGQKVHPSACALIKKRITIGHSAMLPRLPQ
jgi:hypothetical protein